MTLDDEFSKLIDSVLRQQLTTSASTYTGPVGTLTYEKLEQSMKKIDELFPQKGTMYGMRITLTPDTPKMQLGKEVCEYLTPAMIADHNQWLLNFFGVTNALADGDAAITGNDMYMNPRTYQMMRKAVDQAVDEKWAEAGKVVRMADYRR